MARGPCAYRRNEVSAIPRVTTEVSNAHPIRSEQGQRIHTPGACQRNGDGDGALSGVTRAVFSALLHIRHIHKQIVYQTFKMLLSASLTIYRILLLIITIYRKLSRGKVAYEEQSLSKVALIGSKPPAPD